MSKLMSGQSWRRVAALLCSVALLVVSYELFTRKQSPDIQSVERTTVVTSLGAPLVRDELVIAQVSAPNSLDPTFQRGRDTAFAIYYMFDRLYVRDHTMRFVPSLAMYHEVLDDNRTWRFYLRQGIKFHNGNAFKANDVKFTFERYAYMEELGLREPGTMDTKRWLRTTAAIEKVKVIDDYTVDVVLEDAFAPFLVQVALMEMLDEEYYLEVGEEGLSAHPIGSGPYKFVEWTAGKLVLEINEEYWGRIPRQNRTLVFTSIPKTDERIQALESGQVDVIASVSPEYETGWGVRLEDLPGTRAYYIGLSVEDELFDDVRVRQAMNYALDVDAIIRDILKGHARKLQGPLYPETFGYVPFFFYEYNPGKARKLLTEAGYPDGFEVTLDVYPDPNFEQVAAALIAQYAEVGIRVRLNLLEKDACYAKYESGASQMFLTSWGNKEADADPLFRQQFYTDRDKKYTNYSNRILDILIDQGQSALHRQRRLEIYREALEIVIQDAPWVYLYNAYRLCGVSDDVTWWQANYFCPDDQ